MITFKVHVNIQTTCGISFCLLEHLNMPYLMLTLTNLRSFMLSKKFQETSNCEEHKFRQEKKQIDHKIHKMDKLEEYSSI